MSESVVESVSESVSESQRRFEWKSARGAGKRGSEGAKGKGRGGAGRFI